MDNWKKKYKKVWLKIKFNFSFLIKLPDEICMPNCKKMTTARKKCSVQMFGELSPRIFEEYERGWQTNFNVVYCGSQCWVLNLPLATCECVCVCPTKCVSVSVCVCVLAQYGSLSMNVSNVHPFGFVYFPSVTYI